MTGSLVKTGSNRQADLLLLPPGAFEIDPVHTFVTVRAPQLIVGCAPDRFDMVTGTVSVGENVLDSHVEVFIAAGSIATQTQVREDRLHSYEFFEVPDYPSLTFRSKGTAEFLAGEWSIAGDLSIEGVTVTTEMVIEFGRAVSDHFGHLHVGFHAITTISGGDFGLLFDDENHSGRPHVAPDVTIEIDAEGVQPSTSKAFLSNLSLRGDSRRKKRSIQS